MMIYGDQALLNNFLHGDFFWEDIALDTVRTFLCKILKSLKYLIVDLHFRSTPQENFGIQSLNQERNSKSEASLNTRTACLCFQSK